MVLGVLGLPPSPSIVCLILHQDLTFCFLKQADPLASTSQVLGFQAMPLHGDCILLCTFVCGAHTEVIEFQKSFSPSTM